MLGKKSFFLNKKKNLLTQRKGESIQCFKKKEIENSFESDQYFKNKLNSFLILTFV